MQANHAVVYQDRLDYFHQAMHTLYAQISSATHNRSLCCTLFTFISQTFNLSFLHLKSRVVLCAALNAPTQPEVFSNTSRPLNLAPFTTFVLEKHGFVPRKLLYSDGCLLPITQHSQPCYRLHQRT